VTQRERKGKERKGKERIGISWGRMRERQCTAGRMKNTKVN